MILGSDDLEVLEYLKAWKGNYVSMVEICRCAGGRHKFKESPHWAKRLMSRLVDEHLVEVNDRGHYRIKEETAPAADAAAAAEAPVAEDYFAPEEKALIVGDNYFPPPERPSSKGRRWIAPHIESILNKAGKKPAKHQQQG